MDIQLARESDKELWNSYVLAHPKSVFYHLYDWKSFFENIFQHRTFYLMAKTNTQSVVGILPLVWMKSKLFGSFIVSLPYFNYGGILSDNKAVDISLLTAATSIARKHHVKHIEFRHQEDKHLNLKVKTAKVSMMLDLPDNATVLFNCFRSKLRSQIRKPAKEGLTSVLGGIDQIDNFYYVFSRNMRDLGTPVYSKNFFTAIVKVFSKTTKICTVFMVNKPIASGFLLHHNDRVEIPWASSLRKYNHLSPNMMLYWTAIKYAIDSGFSKFDFGRSTPEEGTYKFKQQWGAQPLQLYWHYWLSQAGSLPEINPNNPKYKYAIALWQKFPLFMTKIIGPSIVKNIP